MCSKSAITFLKHVSPLRYCRTIAMELISLESAEEAQQLADYLRPGNIVVLLYKIVQAKLIITIRKVVFDIVSYLLKQFKWLTALEALID